MLFPFHAGRSILLWILAPALLVARESADVFKSAPAAYSARIVPSENHELLRVISVEERVGVARADALVRAPVFLAAGECADPGELAVEDARDGTLVPVQADDIRRGPDGGVSRVHLWFRTSVAPWEKRSFRLVRRAAETAAPLRWRLEGGRIAAETARGRFVFEIQGQRAGQVRELGGLESDGLLPRAVLQSRGAEVAVLPGRERPAVEWSAGPLFWKIRTTWTAAGARLEQTYRIAPDGSLTLAQAVRPAPGRPVVMKERILLQGPVSPEIGVAAVPAGLRHLLRDAHGYNVAALTGLPAGRSAVLVPVTSGGASGRTVVAEGRMKLIAPGGLSQGGPDALAGTIRAFWTELQWVIADGADENTTWQAFHSAVQPLVAVVDEPEVGAEQLQTALRQLVREMKPVGWAQNAARAAVLGESVRANEILQTEPKTHESSAETLRRGAENTWAKLSRDGERPVREDEKSRASGPLDPYHITYTHSAATVLDGLNRAPALTREIDAAYATAAREFLGRVDPEGFPYIDTFSRALNMQMGPLLAGLVANRDGSPAVAQFYRDLAGAPAIRAVFGRAQRPYDGRITATADYSDHLYQAICDYWMRLAEILSGTSLELHPLAFARYTDCVDVLADLYHGADHGDKTGTAPPARANFWRAQPHTHRWLAWSCAPYIRLLETNGDFTGATEAVAHTRMLAGRWKNWPDLTIYAIASLMAEERGPDPVAPESLPLPARVMTEGGPGHATVRWEPVAGAVRYRVYRTRAEGGAWVWLNSPYAANFEPTTATEFADPDARTGDRYFVTAVDGEGRESRWFREERSGR